jgi:hypothetical protein
MTLRFKVYSLQNDILNKADAVRYAAHSLYCYSVFKILLQKQLNKLLIN